MLKVTTGRESSHVMKRPTSGSNYREIVARYPRGEAVVCIAQGRSFGTCSSKSSWKGQKGVFIPDVKNRSPKEHFFNRLSTTRVSASQPGAVLFPRENFFFVTVTEGAISI